MPEDLGALRRAPDLAADLGDRQGPLRRRGRRLRRCRNPSEAADAPSWSRSNTSRCRRHSGPTTLPPTGTASSTRIVPIGNIAWGLMFGDAGRTDAAFEAAPYRVSLQLQNPRLSANPIEPRGCSANTTGRRRLHPAHQHAEPARRPARGWPRARDSPRRRLRVIGPDVGGGFGMKADAYPEDALVLWAIARAAAGRLSGSPPAPRPWLVRRPAAAISVVDGELAFDEDGHASSARVASACTMSAPISHRRGLVPSHLLAALHPPAPTTSSAVARDRRAACSPTRSPLGAYRGAGRPGGDLFDRTADR